MKIALAQQNYHIGNFDANTKAILEAIDRARDAGADLVVFSELCVCGYPPQDFLEFNDFLDHCHRAVETIREYTHNMGVLIGTPVKNTGNSGKGLFNAVHLLADKKHMGTVYKTLLPNYDIFEEARYFEPANQWNTLEFRGKKLAVTICEDIWNMGENPLYPITPMDQLMDFAPDVMINLSASPYNYAQDVVRNSIVRAHTLKYQLPMIYCNAVGAQTEVVFDGGSLVYNSIGQKVKECHYFEPDFFVVDLNELYAASHQEASQEPVFFSAADVGLGKETLTYLTDSKNIEEIYQALILGIRDYFSKMGFQKAILGSSGGIDSALVQALATDALGAENVWAILMPSHYSTSHSVTDAQELSMNLGNAFQVLPIKNIYDAFLSELTPLFKDLPFGVAEENIQSRSRGNLIMALSNKFGHILLNTSNKSELATGYGTLYGDMAGGLGVLGDVYKTQVYALAHYINRNGTVIPNHIITKPPSAELRPDQKDSDSLPDYADLDTILMEYIEGRKGLMDLVQMGFEPQLVTRILKMVNQNEYKRKQFCPIIRVSYKAFGMGRRMPIVGKYAL